MSQIPETPAPTPSVAESRTLRKYLADALVPSLMPHSDALREVQAQFAQFAKSLFTIYSPVVARVSAEPYASAFPVL